MSLTTLVENELFGIKGSAEWGWCAAELDLNFSGLIPMETAHVGQVPVRETLGPLCPIGSCTVRVVISSCQNTTEVNTSCVFRGFNADIYSLFTVLVRKHSEMKGMMIRERDASPCLCFYK